LPSRDKRAMRTKGEGISHSKLVTSYTLRGTRRFKVKGKLAPRYVNPFKIISRKGEVAYQLELPPQLADVQDVFHVSQLKKCLQVLEEQLLMEELDLGGDLTYSERPIKILDT
jgi:hypothetical protein